MSGYKSISQIEEEIEATRYFRWLDYARAIALTEFLLGLERECGDKFRLMTAAPKFICNRSIEDAAEMERTRVFAIGLWASWAIGETHYYMQMNENIFFDAWITRSWRIDNKRLLSEYASPMNDILYADVPFEAKPESVTQLVENFRTAFQVANKRKPVTYIKEIPPYDRQEKQTIYKC